MSEGTFSRREIHLTSSFPRITYSSRKLVSKFKIKKKKNDQPRAFIVNTCHDWCRFILCPYYMFQTRIYKSTDTRSSNSDASTTGTKTCLCIIKVQVKDIKIGCVSVICLINDKRLGTIKPNTVGSRYLEFQGTL